MFIKYIGFIVFTSLKQYFILAKLFKVKFTTTKISCDFLLTFFNIISFIFKDIVTNASASETSIPRGKKENQYFVIDNDIGASDSSVQAVINDTDNSEKTRPTRVEIRHQNLLLVQ
jgi:hypothetical protein